MVRVLIPWKMDFYQPINGYHPLIASFVEAAPAGVDFVIAENGASHTSSEYSLRKITFKFMANAFLIGRMQLDAGLDIARYVGDIIDSRSPAAQWQIESYAGDVDVVLHHTAPLHMTGIPFVIHFESLTTLFWPFINTGSTHNLVLREQPIYNLLRMQLESPNCRGVFTHIKSSHDALVRCFNSDVITAKAKYIPLGVGSPSEMEGEIDAKIQSIPQRNGLNILFTNSAHGNNISFFLRGGLELLIAFEKLLKTVPDATLTIVSNKPPADTLKGASLKNVIWLEQGISEQELFDLIVTSDVFALPSAGLHSYSALRAMKFGSILICSDAPGYEEYVVDGETAIVIPGRLQQVYQPDPETGWMREDYSSVFTPVPEITERLAAAFDWLARHPEKRRDMAVAARDHVERRHALAPWVQGIADLMHA